MSASTANDRDAVGHGRSSHADAREAFRIGWEHYLRQTANDFAEATTYMETAVRLDRDYGRAHAALAILYRNACTWRFDEQLGTSCGDTFVRADKHLRKAESLPTSLGNAAMSKTHLMRGMHDEALAAAARARALEPNDPESHLAMAWALITSGRPDDGILSIEAAMRLNPRVPSHYAQALGVAHFATGRLEEAAHILAKALQRNSSAITLAPLLAATHARLGMRKEARAALGQWGKEATGWEPGKRMVLDSLPFRWATDRVTNQLIDGVNLALLPQDQTIKTLVKTVINGNATERGNAMRKIGLFGALAEEAVPLLIEALKDEDDEIRWCAIATLGRISPVAKSSVLALKVAMEDQYLRSKAEEALKRIISH